MICRKCGTEYQGSPYCPVCNAVHGINIVSDLKNYIDSSNAAFPLSIVALALSTNVPIAGIILSAITGSKLDSAPFILEEYLDAQMLEQYKSAKSKIRIATILKRIALPVSIACTVFSAFVSTIYYILLFMGYM